MSGIYISKRNSTGTFPRHCERGKRKTFTGDQALRGSTSAGGDQSRGSKRKEYAMTQKELILKYIADFGSITSFQAYADLGITQLATRIKELKAKGYTFQT